MNIILNGFYEKPNIPVAQEILKKLNAKFAFINYTFHKFEIANNVDTFWLSYASVYKHGNYPIDQNKLIPLDENIIKEMADYEDDVLKMMDRFEYLLPFTYQQRKRAYLNHLRFWNHIIETKQISCFISANIPHEVFDYIAYGLCKIKNIPTLCFYQVSQIKDTVILLDNIYSGYNKIGKSYEELKLNKQNKSELRLSENYMDYYNFQTSTESNPIPIWVKDKTAFAKIKKHSSNLTTYLKNIFNEFQHSKKSILVRLFNPLFWIKKLYSGFELLLSQIIHMLLDFNLRRNYAKYAIVPDLTKKYIYIALHYQPELTTSPIAGKFVHQDLIVRILSKNLPSGYHLFVKEHPQQTRRSRNKSFYVDLSKLENVTFVDTKVDTYKLIKNAMAIATATGTVGFESLFKNKPILMFGSYVYKFAPGVQHIKTDDECKKAINSIIDNKIKFTNDNLKLYLKAMEQNTFNGCINLYYKQISKIDSDVNISNLSNAVYQHLNK